MVSVIGAGRWGSSIAWYLATVKNEETLLVGRGNESASYRELKEKRQNQYISLPNGIEVTDDVEYAINNSKYIFFTLHSQKLREYLESIKKLDIDFTDKKFVLCMKGIEISTGMRLTQVVKDVIPEVKVAIMVGPAHIQEITKNVPTCMVIDSEDAEYKEELVQFINSGIIRTYIGNDLIGNELGAAMKNVIGIVAGSLDGLGFQQLKGPLMSRGCYEVGKIIASEGGSFFSAYGLAHLGDYEATLFSQNSNNRRYGEYFVTGKEITWHAEGVETCKAAYELVKKNNVVAPITEQCYKVLYEGEDIKNVIETLFARSIKEEFINIPDNYNI